MNGWTDERVEILKKLWLDGVSASEIAKQLGGVSRNAVIGKVHRLGMSGREEPSKPTRHVFKAPRPPRPPRPAITRAPHRAEPPAKTPASAPVFYVEEPGSATLLTLGAHMCKWPIGDPANDSFSFCGRRSGEGPYCIDHTRVAYQPMGKAERSRAARLERLAELKRL